MYNKETIEYLLNNKKKLTSTFKRQNFSNEILEDLTQNILYNLLRKDYKIDNSESFLRTAYINQIMNYRLINKKYYFMSDSLNDENESLLDCLASESTIESDIQEAQIKSILYEAINTLPKTQKKAILKRMDNLNKNTNTEKANYRHAVLKLKRILNERLF